MKSGGCLIVVTLVIASVFGHTWAYLPDYDFDLVESRAESSPLTGSTEETFRYLKSFKDNRVVNSLEVLAREGRCSAGSLRNLRELAEGTQYGKRWPRLHEIIHFYGGKLVRKGCGSHLNNEYRQLEASASILERPNLDVIKEDDEYRFNWSKLNNDCADEHDCVVNTTDLARILRALAERSSNNVYGGVGPIGGQESHQFEENFNQNWKQFIAEPCKIYSEQYRTLAEDAYLAGRYSAFNFNHPDAEFYHDLAQPVQETVYRYFVCKAINQNKLPLGSVFEKLAQEDELRAREKGEKKCRFCLKLPRLGRRKE